MCILCNKYIIYILLKISLILRTDSNFHFSTIQIMTFITPAKIFFKTFPFNICEVRVYNNNLITGCKILFLMKTVFQKSILFLFKYMIFFSLSFKYNLNVYAIQFINGWCPGHAIFVGLRIFISFNWLDKICVLDFTTDFFDTAIYVRFKTYRIIKSILWWFYIVSIQWCWRVFFVFKNVNDVRFIQTIMPCISLAMGIFRFFALRSDGKHFSKPFLTKNAIKSLGNINVEIDKPVPQCIYKHYIIQPIAIALYRYI